MILVAERMFAEMGIYAVSLRQINIEAEQKNGSALHYHFGSREGLISSIFEYRMEPINQRRMEMLEEIKDKSMPDNPDLHSLLRALILPGSAHLEEAGAVTHYSRFIHQTASTYATKLKDLMNNKHYSGTREIRRLIYSALRDIPDPIIEQRTTMTERSIIHALAAFEAMKEEQGDAIGPKEYHLLVNNLTDSFLALLTAPISEQTTTALQSFQANAAE